MGANTELVTSIGDLVRRAGQTYGDRPLWTMGDRTVDYATYDDRTTRAASGLGALGVRPGDRVATYLGNSIELLEAYTAIAKAGAVTVFCNALLTQREIDYVVADSEAVAIICDREHLAVARAAAEAAPGLHHVILADTNTAIGTEANNGAGTDVADGLGAGTEADALTGAEVGKGAIVDWAELVGGDGGRLPGVDVDAEAWIGYTSGTTGRPKGASLSHRNPMWVAVAVSGALGLRAEDRILCCLPMFHSYAVNSCYLQPMLVGAHQRVLPRFGVEEVLDAMAADRTTVFPAVPTMLTYLANARGVEAHDLTALRMVVSAGSVLKEQVIADFEERFGAPIHDGWGSTETGSFGTITPAGAARKAGSCGIGLPGSEVRVVDPSGTDVAPGERGELVVRGPNVMSHYLNKPDQTAATLVDGWYHSGDVATIDTEGYVFVVDRLKDLIISGGYNIAPKEIEDVILAHPAVLDVAVVGVAD
ncbi:MAG: AMP-binding protein, partial [Actinomycetota bacterium]